MRLDLDGAYEIIVLHGQAQTEPPILRIGICKG
jgi:hypothetical protein